MSSSVFSKKTMWGCGLLKRQMIAAHLSEVGNWVQNTNYHQSTEYAVRYVRQLTSKNSCDKEIKGIWLEIENICEEWRKNNNYQIDPNQEAYPIKARAYTTGLNIYNIANDHELFMWLISQDCEPEERTETTSIRIEKLTKEYRWETIFSAAILYLEHFGFHNAVQKYFAYLLNLDASVGRKVREGGSKGSTIAYGSKQEQQQIRSDYQKYVDCLHDKNKSLSYLRIKKLTAKHFGVSTRTIERYTNNPKKKK